MILLVFNLLFVDAVNAVGAILYQTGARRQAQSRLIRAALFAPAKL
jgi:hypothetical protein